MWCICPMQAIAPDVSILAVSLRTPGPPVRQHPSNSPKATPPNRGRCCRFGWLAGCFPYKYKYISGPVLLPPPPGCQRPQQLGRLLPQRLWQVRRQQAGERGQGVPVVNQLGQYRLVVPHLHAQGHGVQQVQMPAQCMRACIAEPRI